MGRATYLLPILLLLGHSSAAQTEYIVTDLGTLPGYADSYAGGINDKGQVVGWAQSVEGVTRAFVWSP